MNAPLRVGIAGCGFIGRKRERALDGDVLVGGFDRDPAAAPALGALAFPSLDALLELDLDVLVVAVPHDGLADLAIAGLETGASVLEIYCRTGKLVVEGVAGSHGPQVLRVYAMKPELGPPDVEETAFSPQDVSRLQEWRSVRQAVRTGSTALDDLEAARYAWTVIEGAYERSAT